MQFDQMGLIDPITKALHEEGYTTPTPIQAQAIPQLLQGRDLLGCAQTGTGKTAAFALPILQYLHQNPVQDKGRKPIRALILTPTRELAIQIEESLRAYGRHLPLKHLVIFGGVGQQPQVDGLRRGVDILVATPGRLLDLIQQGYIGLSHIEVFVLDEADRMLDMGFVHDVKRIITKLPTKRHTLFFSATMPPDIQDLANSILTNPVKVEVTPVSSTADTIQQHLFHVQKNDKRHLLLHLLKSNPDMRSVLVFTRTKHGADRVVKDLMRAGETAAAIHGNKSQNARQLALQNFKKGVVRVLVATDIAARGIDIDELGFVINYELPNVPETYVHRIGRTGRAGASGIAYSFCEGEERAYLKDIQKLIGKQIPVIAEHPYAGAHANREETQKTEPVRQPQQGGGNRQPQQQRRGEQQQRRQQPNQQNNQQRRDNGGKKPGQQPGQRKNNPPVQRPEPVAVEKQAAHAENRQNRRPAQQQPPRKRENKILSNPVAKPMKNDNFQSSIVPPSKTIFDDEDRW